VAAAQCISIEHPSRLYVTDDYIVTHNTLTALASVAHVHSIGAKKKTAFVVPNSVLSNWKKEATGVYTSLDDCLFVGLTIDKKGRARVNSSDYDRDLNIIRENRHRKIFMTMEAFQRIRLREETIDRYETFLRSVDVSFAESEDKKASDIAEGKTKRLTALLQKGKSGAAPFLEDLGIDAVVIDEGHCFPAGTLVGGVPIELLRVGDLVESFNHQTGMMEMKPVTDVMSRPVAGLVRVHFEGGASIVCTQDHPIFVPGFGYVAAEFLNNGYHVAFNNSKIESQHEKNQSRRDQLPSVRNPFCSDKVSAPVAKEREKSFLLTRMQRGNEAGQGSDFSGLPGVRQERRAEPCA
jgi:hypothetical protein